jgi:hypothetical protein
MMQQLNLHEWTTFKGCLSFGTDSTELEFNLKIDDTGEIQFCFPQIAFSQSKFIRMEDQKSKSVFANFSLCGKANDGTIFQTQNLHFKSVKWSFNKEEGSQTHVKGDCANASLTRYSDFTELPILKMYLRGLSTVFPLHATCAYGKLVVAGSRKDIDDEKNHLCGSIIIQPESLPQDVEAWRKDAYELLNHIRDLFSLSASAKLKAPIIEYRYIHELRIDAKSQTEQTTSALRILPEIAQEAMLKASISSFFNPPVQAKNLNFAIEWFAMDADYTEVRLVSAMTALENLINSNLTDADRSIEDQKHFDKTTRRVLRNLIKACLKRWPVDDAKRILSETNEKLADLNRRSFMANLYKLAERWSVPLEGFTRERIAAAVAARNSIVHRGQYYDDGRRTNTELVDLWEHVTIIRELVVRFLLIAVGYSGQYGSYMGGFHIVTFPPSSGSA